ncbi:MAG: phosphomannose isomerase type II C-terminal cupin domain [Endomicrobium sp.]|jgi:mannose-6-phosphate isomerase-like protein (cupin superfamily)|nr:phosphomannose isomerase type II C-terminal cupin domain [Endomicrobium sp.]
MSNAYKKGVLVKRQWGEYKVIHTDERFTIKTLTILPGKCTSLQTHKYRHEHWIVVQGKIVVALDKKTYKLEENDYIYIKKGSKHKLSNKGKKTAILTETQQGNVLDENDIVRFD